MASYAGISSSHRNGEETHVRDNITKCDFVATQRMTDTVTVSIRFNPCVKSIHERIAKRHSKQKTRVVVARHVLEIVWHMLATM